MMPLTNDSWSQGKCGFKILQYMGAGIPVIASPVGVNKNIITDGINGFLAKNNEEWKNKLSILIENENIRNNFSKLGYETVNDHFNIKNEEIKYLKEINLLKEKIYSRQKIKILDGKKTI